MKDYKPGKVYLRSMLKYKELPSKYVEIIVLGGEDTIVEKIVFTLVDNEKSHPIATYDGPIFLKDALSMILELSTLSYNECLKTIKEGGS